MTYVGDSAGEGDLLLEPGTILCERGVLLDEFVNIHLNIELVGIGVCDGIFLQFIDHLGPVLVVGSGVENLLLLDFLLLTLSLLGFLSCLLGLFCLELLLLFQALLLIFAELLSLLSCGGLLSSNRLYFFFLGMLRLLRFVTLHRYKLDKRK